MPQSPDRLAIPGPLRPRAVAAIIGLAVSGSLVLGLPGLGMAQDDGTGAATPPPPTDCLVVQAKADVILPGAATPAAGAAEASPVASPVASPQVLPIIEPAGSLVASPQASPVLDLAASPVASPAATPDVVDPNAALLAELETIANSIFGCLNERNFDEYAQLTSDTVRGQQFGSSEPLPADLFAQLAATLPDSDHRIVDFGNLVITDEATVSVDVTYVSAYQLKSSTWTFVRAKVDGLQTWVLDRETPLPVRAPAGASTIAVTLEDAGYALSPDRASGPDLVLSLDNPTGEDHEALVVRLDPGVTSASLLQGGTFPDGVTFIGQATVLAGGTGTLVLTSLAPGTYTIVDLLPDANSLPHLSSGMEATFTID